MKRRRWIIVGGVALLCLFGLVVGTCVSTRELVFRGKTESEWVNRIRSSNTRASLGREDPVRDEFIEMGPDAARFLGEALDRRNSASAGFYRSLYSRLPKAVQARLPDPYDRIIERMAIQSLLGRMGTNALPAEPEIARCLRNRDRRSVMFASACYADDKVGGWGGLFNLMNRETRRRRVPDLLAALEFAATRPRDWGWFMREDEALLRLCQVLGNQRELASTISPALTNLFTHPDPTVQAAAWQALARLDREAAIQLGAVNRAIRFLDDRAPTGPGDGWFYPSTQDFGAVMLGDLAAEPDVSLPALTKAAYGSNAMLAESAIKALGNFSSETNKVVPVLMDLLKGTRETTAAAARRALRKIDPATADRLGLP